MSTSEMTLYGFGIKPSQLLSREAASVHLTTDERRDVEVRQLLATDRALRRSRKRKRLGIVGAPRCCQRRSPATRCCTGGIPALRTHARHGGRCARCRAHAERRPDDVVARRLILAL